MIEPAAHFFGQPYPDLRQPVHLGWTAPLELASQLQQRRSDCLYLPSEPGQPLTSLLQSLPKSIQHPQLLAHLVIKPRQHRQLTVKLTQPRRSRILMEFSNCPTDLADALLQLISQLIGSSLREWRCFAQLPKAALRNGQLTADSRRIDLGCLTCPREP